MGVGLVWKTFLPWEFVTEQAIVTWHVTPYGGLSGTWHHWVSGIGWVGFDRQITWHVMFMEVGTCLEQHLHHWVSEWTGRSHDKLVFMEVGTFLKHLYHWVNVITHPHVCVCVSLRERVRVVIVNCPALPPCLVDGCSGNPLCYYWWEVTSCISPYGDLQHMTEVTDIDFDFILLHASCFTFQSSNK